MRILLLSHAEITRNPRARTLAATLVAAGHEVIAVCGGAGTSSIPNVTIQRVPTRVPRRWGRLGWLIRRIQPTRIRRTIFERSFARAAESAAADLIYPMSSTDLVTAMAIVSPVQAIFREPNWPTAGDRDISDLAPYAEALSSSPAGRPAPFYTKADSRAGHRPDADRHAGIRIAFVSQRTTTTPAQYLETAAERAGMDVARHDGALNWDEVHPETAAVVFVESPYPALEVTGHNKHGIPVLYWIHHGEHHLPANLRLLERYGAHVVLLAHSWHLAHRFPVPVHRFPFAVPTELMTTDRQFSERKDDVAMVGAGVEGGTGRYARRQQLVDTLKRRFPHTNSFAYGVPPERMAEIYGNSRVVLNEGGDRHRPVTMRVFEAIGAGALLLTDDAPGLDLLFEKGGHYELIVSDIADQVTGLLADPNTRDRAAAAQRHAIKHHLYDHRIDDLLAIARGTKVFAYAPPPPREGVAALIDHDLDVQEIALFGIDDLAGDLASHVIWDGTTLLSTTHDRMVDAVVLGPYYRHRVDVAVERARRFIYAYPDHHETLERYAQNRWPDATCLLVGDILRVDLGTKSYRLRAAGHPLAGA
jgi:hypothetical protein